MSWRSDFGLAGFFEPEELLTLAELVLTESNLGLVGVLLKELFIWVWNPNAILDSRTSKKAFLVVLEFWGRG